MVFLSKHLLRKYDRGWCIISSILYFIFFFHLFRYIVNDLKIVIIMRDSGVIAEQ